MILFFSEQLRTAPSNKLFNQVFVVFPHALQREQFTAYGPYPIAHASSKRLSTAIELIVH
jgi:hypothetical protein